MLRGGGGDGAISLIFVRHGHSCANFVKDFSWPIYPTSKKLFVSDQRRSVWPWRFSQTLKTELTPDPHLTQIGVQQAKASGKLFAKRNDDGHWTLYKGRVFTSGLFRTMETAAHFVTEYNNDKKKPEEQFKLELEPLPYISEQRTWAVEDADNQIRPLAEVQKDFAIKFPQSFTIIKKQDYEHTVFDKEKFIGEVIPYLQGLAAESGENTFLIFSHKKALKGLLGKKLENGQIIQAKFSNQKKFHDIEKWSMEICSGIQQKDCTGQTTKEVKRMPATQVIKTCPNQEELQSALWQDNGEGGEVLAIKYQKYP